MNRRDALWLICLATGFLAWQVPLEYRTGGGQDESWYGIAGSMVLRRGLPRIPYFPARDPRSACYMADVVLFAHPPLNPYVQALVHLVLGDGLGPARLASTLAGLAAAFLVYALARTWFDDSRISVLATLAFITSRSFIFPATMARPDMLTAACGLLALWLVVRYQRTASVRLLSLSGAAAGLALLSHPFGVVPAIQVGLTVLATPGTLRQRFTSAAIYSAMALAVFALWLPLIAMYPQVFRHQFGSNVLSRAGPELGSTMYQPWLILYHQLSQFWRFVHPLQGATYAAALVWTLVRARVVPAGRELAAHCLASAALLFLFQGRHPAIGYYVYPAALLSIAVGQLARDLAGLIERWARGTIGHAPGVATCVLTCALLLAFLPGAGLRALAVHIRHAHDPNYDAHLLTRAVMADVPEHALVASDGRYIIDLYLAGRDVVELTIHPLMFDARELPFEYAVFGRPTLELYKSQIPDLVFMKSYGDRDDLFSEYAELYRIGRRTLPTEARARVVGLNGSAQR